MKTQNMKNQFFSTIESAMNCIPDNQVIAKDFLSDRTDIRRYVIGKNDESISLINIVKIDGIIDDFAKTQSYWKQVPIVKSTEIPSNSIVVNCSTSISPITVNKNLLAAGVKNLINLHEVIYASNGNISLPMFIKQMRKNYGKYSSEWFKVYQLMLDEKSKKTLLDIIRYRLTGDINYMQEYSVRLNDQYFENYMRYDAEVFVDIGGFDGDTTDEFCRLYPNYKKVFFFEPSVENMLAAKNRLKNFNNIEYIPFGLSDEDGVLTFDNDSGSASAVIETGNTTIDVTTLDNKVKEPVSFIKMDIEGWELKALNGCKNHIINDRPKLAIAVYHHAKDFYEIPNFILSLNIDYKLSLRHYTEGWSETVMYFMPK